MGKPLSSFTYSWEIQYGSQDSPNLMVPHMVLMNQMGPKAKPKAKIWEKDT